MSYLLTDKDYEELARLYPLLDFSFEDDYREETAILLKLRNEKALRLATPDIEAKEREMILKIYNETIVLCPEAGLVAILQALKEGGR